MIQTNIYILLNLYLWLGLSYITFDQGDFTSFDYPTQDVNFYCLHDYNNAKWISVTITFSGTFANNPEIIILPYHIDFTTYVQSYIFEQQFRTYVTNITPTNFIFKVVCESYIQLYSLQFKWLAIDDKRIEVITVPWEEIPIPPIQQTFTYSHSNQNVAQGFISGFLGIQTQAWIDISLSISSITPEKVTVEVIKPSNSKGSTYPISWSGVTHIEFQIILGPLEAFTVYEKIALALSPSNIYDSGIIALQPGYKLLLPIMALTYDSEQILRLTQSYTDNGSTVRYQKWSWSVESDGVINSLGWQEIYYNTDNKKFLYPFQFTKKMRISKGIYLNQDAFPFKMEIKELNQVYTATSDPINLKKTDLTLNVVVTLKCQQGKKIQGIILECALCPQQNFNINQNCYGGINQIAYYITLHQIEQVYQQIQVVVTSSSIALTQYVLNQVATTFTVIQLEIVDQ